jgi:undecaprenyl pyrophosphate synthase
MEREEMTGKRNVIIYHTAGQKIDPIKELKADLIGKIYSIQKIEIPEEKTWNNIYTQAVDKLNESGQSIGHYIATATGSNEQSAGLQLAVCVKYDLNMAENLKDLRAGGCCTIF